MATLLALGIPPGGAAAVMLSNLAQVAILAVVGFAFIFVAGFIVKIRLRALIPIVFEWL